MKKTVTKRYGYSLTRKEFQDLQPTKVIVDLPEKKGAKNLLDLKRVINGAMYPVVSVMQDLAVIKDINGDNFYVSKEHLTITECTGK